MHYYSINLYLSVPGAEPTYVYSMESRAPLSQKRFLEWVIDLMRSLPLTFVEFASAFNEQTGEYYSVYQVTLPSPVAQ